MEFEELKKVYYEINSGCCKCGRVYNFRENRLNPVFCKMWSCDRCRKILKYWLYIATIENCYMFNLDKHFIITSEGKNFRKKYSYIDSFYHMSEMWRAYRRVIEYHYGNINYILFPRSQKDGFCHYHLIIDKYIDWNFLNKKRKKYNLGYVRINENQDIADYLHKDFFKDNEYIIPFGIKHYVSSRGICLRNYLPDKLNKIYFKTNDREFIYDTINDKFGYPLPFEEYVKQYIELIK